MKTRKFISEFQEDSKDNANLHEIIIQKEIKIKAVSNEESYRDTHNIGRRKSNASVVTYSLNSHLFFDVYAKFDKNPVNKIVRRTKVTTLNNVTLNGSKMCKALSESLSTDATIDCHSNNSSPKRLKVYCEAEPLHKDEIIIPSPKIDAVSPFKSPCKTHTYFTQPMTFRVSSDTDVNHSSNIDTPTTITETFQRILENKTVFKKHLSKVCKSDTKLTTKNKVGRPSLKRLSKGLKQNKKMIKNDDKISANQNSSNKIATNQNSMNDKSINQKCLIKRRSRSKNKVERGSCQPSRQKRIASLNAAAIINCVQFNEERKRSQSSTRKNEEEEDIKLELELDAGKEDGVSMEEDNKVCKETMKKRLRNYDLKKENKKGRGLKEEKPKLRGRKRKVFKKAVVKKISKRMNKLKGKKIRKYYHKKEISNINVDDKYEEDRKAEVTKNRVEEEKDESRSRLKRVLSNKDVVNENKEELAMNLLGEELKDISILIGKEFQEIKQPGSKKGNYVLRKHKERPFESEDDEITEKVFKTRRGRKKHVNVGERRNGMLEMRKEFKRTNILINKRLSASKNKTKEKINSKSVVNKGRRCVREVEKYMPEKSIINEADINNEKGMIIESKLETIIVDKRPRRTNEPKMAKKIFKKGARRKKEEDKIIVMDGKDGAVSSLWMWEGECEDRLIQVELDGAMVCRQCYTAIRHAKDNVEVRLNDAVLVRSADGDPYLAKITAFYDDQDNGKKMMVLLWYYRPEHTEQGRQLWHTDADIYASMHLDTNSVDCIEDKAFVLPLELYARFLSHHRRQSTSSRQSLATRIVPLIVDDSRVPESDGLSMDMFACSFYYQSPFLASFPPEMTTSNVFVCRGLYDIKQHRVTKNILPLMPVREPLERCASPDSAMSISSCYSDSKARIPSFHHLLASIAHDPPPSSHPLPPPTSSSNNLFSSPSPRTSTLPHISSFASLVPRSHTTLVTVSKYLASLKPVSSINGDVLSTAILQHHNGH